MRPTIKHVQETVAEFYSVSPKIMSEKMGRRNRYDPMHEARHVAMFFARRLTGRSYQMIANHFNRLDHTTVFYGARKIEERIEADPSFAANMLALSAVIGGGKSFGEQTRAPGHVSAAQTLSVDNSKNDAFVQNLASA